MSNASGTISAPPAPSIVLITGGASGIGLATAQAVLARGGHAIIADAAPAALDFVRGSLAQDGAAVHCELLDVTDEAAVTDLIARCEAELGPLTGVVNSAGIARDVDCLDTSTALFRQILEVNLIGTFVVAREAARVMSARRQGSIVNIASVSGIRGNAGRVAYGASKAGVIQMTQVMAAELGPRGVRVNAVAPGPIDTALTRGMHTAASRAAWTERTPQRRYGTPEDVAAAVIFLLDDRQSAYVTGHTLRVDGGFSAAGVLRQSDAG